LKIRASAKTAAQGLPTPSADPEGFLVCLASPSASKDTSAPHGKLALLMAWWSCYLGFCKPSS
jgi:hypothetical protein